MRSDYKNLYLVINKYTGKSKKLFLLSFFMLIATTVFGFLQPLLIQCITDRGIIQLDMQSLFISLLILGGVVLGNQLVDICQTFLFLHIHNNIYTSMFGDAFHKLLHLNKRYFEDKSSAEVLNVLQFDVSQVSSLGDRTVIASVGYIFRFFSGLVGLFLISWQLSLVILMMVPIKFIVVSRLSKKRSDIMEETMETTRVFSKWFGDNQNGIDEIKLWNLYKEKIETFHHKVWKIIKTQRKGVVVDILNSFSESMLEWCVTLAIYGLGGLMVYLGKMTVGAVFAFVSYSWYITYSVTFLLNFRMMLSRIIPSANRLSNFFNMSSETNVGQQDTQNSNPSIELIHVSFEFEKGQPILKDINLKINPGEKIAIVGKNGSGKTTLIGLLLRFFQPTQGSILMDGTNIENVMLDSYRNLFAVVSQNPYLFIGNIIENIDLKGNATPDKLNEVLSVSGVADLIKKKLKGRETPIGNNGARLSGGEKQKIAVARALLKDAPIIILDEATSNFDNESNAFLHDMVINHMSGETVISITHRYEDMHDMDRVYCLVDGKLEEYVEGMK